MASPWKRHCGANRIGGAAFHRSRHCMRPRSGVTHAVLQHALAVHPGVSHTGVNPAGDAGDTSPQSFRWGDVNGNIPNIITYFPI